MLVPLSDCQHKPAVEVRVFMCNEASGPLTSTLVSFYTNLIYIPLHFSEDWQSILFLAWMTSVMIACHCPLPLTPPQVLMVLIKVGGLAHGSMSFNKHVKVKCKARMHLLTAFNEMFSLEYLSLVWCIKTPVQLQRKFCNSRMGQMTLGELWELQRNHAQD